MSIIQKIKLILGAKKVADQIQEKLPEAPKTGFMAKLDGTKSITGLLMIIGYYVGPQFGVKVPDIFLTIGTAWAGVGFVHKLEKTTGVLGKGLQILSAVMTALNKTKNTINGDKK